MNKPASMTIKEFIIKKIAVNRLVSKMVSEKTIDAVISHQFESAHAATAYCNSIEISGFGKFSFNIKRANKQMDKYNSQMAMYTKMLEDETISPAVKRNTEMRIQTTLDNIKVLKPKLDE
jgi:nucleoid DNA-binding protein